MQDRYDTLLTNFQGILDETVGRQVKMFGDLKEKDEVRVLNQYDLVKMENDRSFKVALYFTDSSSLVFEKVVAATIDWGFPKKRTQPLVWLCQDRGPSSFSKMQFDVKH